MREHRKKLGGGGASKLMAKAPIYLPRGLARAFALALLGVILSLGVAVPKAAANPLDSIGAAVMQLLGIGDAEPAAAFGEEKTVDPSTIATWSDIIQNDTENIGRIWTDKTVSSTSVQLPASPDGTAPSVDIGDSDFLVTLSALSSTSNTTTTSSKPLDIVLVLDASGSMDDELTSEYRYNEVYNINTDGRTTYYAKNANGSYTKIDRITRTVLFWQLFDHWELNDQTVNPKTSAQDSDSSHIQFYTYDEVTTKMAALHDAANAFIENTAAQNDAIDDAAKQHRISLVKFASDKSNTVGNDTMGGWNDYNYSQIMTNLTAYTSDDVASATSMVDGLTASGATSADYGMQHAQTVLASARDDAQKVVIFFTDGEPNHQSGFDGTVANAAISAAKALKDENTLVYTIGMFADADPSNTSTSTNNQFNAYMHAVSSNYPKASAWNSLGGRVSQDSAYYKAATNAAELNQIFQEISDEINAGTGLPTETIDGAEGTSGYITFTDELGAYMEADSFKSIVFADEVFSNPVKKSSGLIDTYTFEGEHAGNALYPNGNLNQVIVTVQRSNELAQGDVVTVKVPAGLIPLRKFTVTDENGTAAMDIAEAYPLRVFYGVSVKQGVYDALANGTADQTLKSYIAANADDGKTSFYSNYYDGTVTSGDKTLGNTTASFVPAEGNSFYYFTENTALYTDEKCTQKLTTEPHEDGIYYYKRSYYAKDAQSGEVTKKDSITRFVGANFSASTTFWGQANDGSYYIKAGARRITRIDDLTLSKTTNDTNTASEVINPNWDNINNPDTMNVSLGNNGKIAVELPGTLAIHKDAQVAADLSADVLEDKSFEFEIKVASAANKKLSAVVKNEQGDTQGDPFVLTFDAQGKATHPIMDGETLYIYGLDAGADYTVIEVADKLPAGFKQTSATGDTGIIAGNVVTTASFVNTYEAKLIHNDAGGLVVTKTTYGHAMTEGQFRFQIEALEGTGITAEDTAKRIGIKEGATGEFGNVAGDAGEKVEMTSPNPIEFTQADAGKVFKLKVSEQGADGKFGTGGTKDGYTYDGQVYTVELSVADNGDGTLTLTTKVTDKDDKVVTNETSTAANPKATHLDFVNTYEASTIDDSDVNLTATKTLNGRDMAADEFSFKVVSNPLDEAGTIVDVLTGGKNAASDNGKAANIDFGNDNQLDYKLKDLKELAADTTANKYVEVGTTDGGKTQYTLHYTALEETGSLPTGVSAVENAKSFDFTVTVVDNGDGTLTATPQYPDGGLAFVNTYQWDPAVIDPDTLAERKVTKVLKGNRSTALAESEFEFTMTTEATEGSLDTVTDAEGNVWTAEKTAKNAADGSVDFGTMKFSQPGTYKVTISEKPGTAEHMTYDGHAFTYTIKATYNNATGELTAAVEDAQGSATFTNVYSDNTEAKDVALIDEPTTSVNGKLVGVGDTLAYTIDWVNNAVDENGAPCTATVTVTDKIPAGTELVEGTISGNGALNESGDTIAWTFENQEPGASGTVSFTVKVTEDAVKADPINNKAELTIGKNKPISTNETENFVPEKSVEDKTPDTGVQVGDTLTYTIKYMNTEKEPAQVIVTDVLPKGLTVVENSISTSGAYNKEARTITWTINDVPAGKTGAVTFDAVVNEQALVEGADGSTANTAQVQVGDKPSVSTNTTPDHEFNTGSASIKKTVKVPEGALIDTDQEFSFTVELLDAAENPLNGSYNYKTVDAGDQEFTDGTIANGEGKNTITLKHGQTATISGLPEGAKVKATETEVKGYTADELAKTSAAVEANKTAAIEFVNTYSFGEGITITGENSIRAQKDLQGRA